MLKNDIIQLERVYRQAMAYENDISMLPPAQVQCLALILLGLPPQYSRPKAARAVRKALKR